MKIATDFEFYILFLNLYLTCYIFFDLYYNLKNPFKESAN